MRLFGRRSQPPATPVPAPVNFLARSAADPRELPTIWRPAFLEERAYPQSAPSYQVGQPVSIPSDMADLKDAYGLIPAAFAGVRVIASTAAKIPVTVYRRRKGKDEAISEHPLSEMLHPTYGKVNPWATALMGWNQIFSDQQLMGTAYLLKDVITRGRPEELHALRPDWVKPIPGKKRPVDAYEYTAPGSKTVTYPAEKVIPFAFYNPLSPFIGHSPLLPVRKHMVLELFMLALNTAFFKNGATLGGVIMFKQVLQNEKLKAYMERFNEDHRGPSNAYQWRGVSGAEGVHELGLNNKDLQYNEGLDVMENRVLRSLGVPPVVVGSMDGASYANADAQMKLFYETTIQFICALRDAAINLHLAPAFEEGVYVESDFTNVEALLPAMDQVRQAVDTAFRATLITRGEARQWMNKRRIPDLAPRPDDEELFQPSPAVDAGDAGQQNGDPQPDGPARRLPGTIDDLIERSAEDFEAQKRETAKKKAQTIDARVEKARPRMERVVTSMLNREEEHLLENTGELSPDDLSKIEDLLRALRSKNTAEYEAGIRRLVGTFGPLAMKDLDVDVSFDAVSESVLRYIADTAARKVVFLDQTTGEVVREEIRKALVAAQLAGQNVTETATGIMEAGIRAGFEIRRSRATTIAQTEGNAAYSFADLEAMRQSDIAETKVWNTVGDDDVRDSHAALEGAEVPLNEPFNVGGHLMQHPGDPNGPAEEVIECRCFLTVGRMKLSYRIDKMRGLLSSARSRINGSVPVHTNGYGSLTGGGVRG